MKLWDMILEKTRDCASIKDIGLPSNPVFQEGRAWIITVKPNIFVVHFLWSSGKCIMGTLLWKYTPYTILSIIIIWFQYKERELHLSNNQSTQPHSYSKWWRTKLQRQTFIMGSKNGCPMGIVVWTTWISNGRPGNPN